MSQIFRGEIRGIPFLSSCNLKNEKKPLVILCHGFTGKKEVFIREIEELSEIGYYAVAMDNSLHGKRKGDS